MNALDMKHSMAARWQAAILLSAMMCGGCGGDAEEAGMPSVDPQVLALYRSQIMLTEEPEDAVVLLEARNMLEEPEGLLDAAPPDAIVGLIGGMPNPWIDTEPAFPWKEGIAAFYLADPPTAMEFDSGGHVHDDPNECVFCSARARGRLDAFALVSLVDAEGNPLPIDARQLLDVTMPATVVVRGKAKIMGEMMAIEADGIYVRQ